MQNCLKKKINSSSITVTINSVLWVYLTFLCSSTFVQTHDKSRDPFVVSFRVCVTSVCSWLEAEAGACAFPLEVKTQSYKHARLGSCAYVAYGNVSAKSQPFSSFQLRRRLKSYTNEAIE